MIATDEDNPLLKVLFLSYNVVFHILFMSSPYTVPQYKLNDFKNFKTKLIIWHM